MKKYNVTVNGVTYEVEVEEAGSVSSVSDTAVKAAPAPAAAPAPSAPAKQAPAAGSATVNAPMPGTILKMNVKVGDKVEKDSLICVLEAMKMENEIFTPTAGTVVQINAPQGASVASGDVIVTLA